MDVGRQGKKTLTSQIVRLLENIHKVLPEISFFCHCYKAKDALLLWPCFHILKKSPSFENSYNIAGGRQGQKKKLPPNSKWILLLRILDKRSVVVSASLIFDVPFQMNRFFFEAYLLLWWMAKKLKDLVAVVVSPHSPTQEKTKTEQRMKHYFYREK